MKKYYVNWDEHMILSVEGFEQMEEALKTEMRANLAKNPEYSFETWVNARYTAHDVISSSEAWQMSLAHEYTRWFNRQGQELVDEALVDDWEEVYIE